MSSDNSPQRKRVILSRLSSTTYGSEHKLERELRRNRLHKRRRGDRSSASSSSSSSTDTDETLIQSPSKKKVKHKFPTVAENVKGVGMVGKKELKMLMEVQPIAVNPTVTFKSVGGLGSFIDKLKEIVLFPLLYHEFYEQRGMSAPKGILLHGPPGTGKTLLARALSNECSNINGRKVSFFLRKGADLLNKFVGESERQLRMLFQQAAMHQPSIIFFDEIDGLAPVRSAKSDQIHNSIVSSLLAEIDGLQDRGQIIVMGSTNRLDFVDPALRRPGRFDCELPIFLPTRNGRKEILEVHVSRWKDSPSDTLLNELADRSIGFNGADLKFLCWQSTMNSLRRTYPQIYGSSQKYLLNYDSIKIDRDDWEEALKSIAPSTQRSLFSTYSPAQPLPSYIQPLLRKQLKIALAFLENIFPSSSMSLLSESSVKRLLIHTEAESGLNTFVIPALLHALEKVPVYVLSFEALHMDGGNVEFCVTQKCLEVMKQPQPCICYLPDFERLCDLLSDSAKEIMIRMMNQSLQKPILFLATVEGKLSKKFGEFCDLMALFNDRVLQIPIPSSNAVQQFFQPIFEEATKVKIVRKPAIDKLVELPLAPPEPKIKPKFSEEELKAMERQESSTFRELRIFLRQILNKLVRNKKFEDFSRPVDTEDVPDYLDVISHPMDFESMMIKLNSKEYCSAKEFIDDIHLIYENCLAYNPHKTESDKRIRTKAFELKDFAEKLIEDEMDSDFERECHQIIQARLEREHDGKDGDRPHLNTKSKKSEIRNPKSISITPPVKSRITRVNIAVTPTPTGSNSGSRPASAKMRKRKSGWSKGLVKKRPPPAYALSHSVRRNLQTRGFTKLSQSQESRSSIQNGSSPVDATASSDVEAVVEVDIVGDDSPRECENVLEESPEMDPARIRAVPRISRSSSSRSRSTSSRSPPGPADLPASISPRTSSEAVVLIDADNLNFYPCKRVSHYARLFQELLDQTMDLCQTLSVVKLIDVRFQLLRLVAKHSTSEDKEDLYLEMKNWLKEVTRNVGSAWCFPVPPESSTFTMVGNGFHKKKLPHAVIRDRRLDSVALKVKAPASSAPAQIRFNGLERSQKPK